MDFVKKKHASFEVQGCGAFAFKEKLKKLNVEIEKWGKEKFGDLKENMGMLVNCINNLDMKEAIKGLSLEVACETEELIKKLLA